MINTLKIIMDTEGAKPTCEVIHGKSFPKPTTDREVLEMLDRDFKTLVFALAQLIDMAGHKGYINVQETVDNCIDYVSKGISPLTIAPEIPNSIAKGDDKKQKEIAYLQEELRKKKAADAKLIYTKNIKS